MYRGEDFPDMSEYLVHFTKDTGPRPPLPADASEHARFYRSMRSDTQTAYWNMLDILGEQHLRPGPRSFGTGKNLHWLGDIRRAVCLSETPAAFASRIARHYSAYGIAFTQEFVASRRGARVWYLDLNGLHEQAWTELMSQKEREQNAKDRFWGLATTVDRPGIYPRARYQFEWEREWRIPGAKGLRFAVDDVQFLFIPEDLHDAARGFFADAVANNSGPGYDCPLIDPFWTPDQIETALNTTGTVGS
jgi:hypothetical protein